MTSFQIAETITNYMPHGTPRIKIPLSLAVTLGNVFYFLAKLTGYNFSITAARIKKFATSTHHKADKIRKLGFMQKIEIREGFRKMVE